MAATTTATTMGLVTNMPMEFAAWWPNSWSRTATT